MSNPEYLFIKPFAWDGLKNDIQESQQVGQDPEDATINKGFPLITMTPAEAGGKPPKGQDMNGILYAVSSDASHRQKGLRIQFDAAYAAKIGGYSAGAIIASNDYTKDYRSLIDGNTTDPNSSNIAGKWEIYSGVGSVPLATSTTTGTVKLVNNLTSTAVDAALAAAQGKALKDLIDTKLSASSALGINQTWQNLTSSRSLGTTYTNTTGKPIQVAVSWEQANQNETTLFVGSVAVARGRQNQVGGGGTVQAIVPNNTTYRVTGGNSITLWAELR